MESSSTKTRSKNRGFKTRLFLCFKPVAAVDDAFESSTYSCILSSALTTVAECNEGTGGWRRWRKKRVNDNCLWQILKKALNDTTLLKKIKNRKTANKNQFTRSSNIKLEGKSGKISKERKSNRSSLDSSASSSSRSSSFLTRSSLSSSTSSSSSSRTLASSSPSSTKDGNIFGFTNKKHVEDNKDSGKGLGSNFNNNGLFFIMISSLVVLIFWGKFFAILYTSIWFYLVPHRSWQCNRLASSHRVVDEFDSVEYKKKIIMKGLLERNRSRLSIDSTAKS